MRPLIASTAIVSLLHRVAAGGWQRRFLRWVGWSSPYPVEVDRQTLPSISPCSRSTGRVEDQLTS